MTDPRPAYAGADVVLGMGGSAARALAFGRPLIVIGEQGSAETFTPINAELLFRNSFWSDRAVQDPEQHLLSELVPLLDDGDRRRELGTFGRHFASEHFGLAEMARRQVAIYEQALATYGLRQWLADAVDTSARKIAKWPHRLTRRFRSLVRWTMSVLARRR
jgi:hypothetical protein